MCETNVHIINRFGFVLKQIDFIFKSNADINSGDDYATSFQGTLIFNSTIMCLQTIGETIKKVYVNNPEIFKECTNIPWPAIIGLRNLISHDYGAVDPEIVFDIVSHHLLQLKEAIQKICDNQS